jgi:hypothetical protein
MMIPPDHEIYEVEKRIAERRHRVEAVARQTGRAALKTLTSPWTLAGAAAIGFLVASGLQRRYEHRAVSLQTKRAARAGGIASIAMAAATWIIKLQFGSPVAMAQFFLSKVKKQPAQPVRASPGDRVPATTRR